MHALDLLTHALTLPELVQPALLALRGRTEPAVVEALVELLHRPHTTTTRLAVEMLGEILHPLTDATLLFCLESDLASVRQTAIETFARRGVVFAEPILRRLREDASWPTRRAALHALASHEGTFWHILDAADDPHWRVRNALLGVLAPAGLDQERQREIRVRLEKREHPRIRGVLRYLDALWRGDWTLEPAVPIAPPSWPGQDPDPAVMLRNLAALSPAGCRSHLSALVGLLGHDDERIGKLVGQFVRRYGQAADIVASLAWLDEPRINARPGLDALMSGLDLDRIEEATRLILDQDAPSSARLAWAVDQIERIDPTLAPKEIKAPVLATYGSDWRIRLALAEQSDTATRSRLQADIHPLVRAAALTQGRAQEILAHPEIESSWHVRARAALLCRVPLWHLEPEPAWEPVSIPAPVLPPLAPALIATPHERALGPEQILVAPVGLSGHYGLPVEGFVAGIEAGVNVLFWEPNYTTLTAFSCRIPASTRRTLHFMAGTFEATAKRVRADAERALRHLRIESLALFLLFWTRTWDRLDDDLRRVLDDLVREGKVIRPMLSTHDRTLAVEAIAGGWNPLMVRHSAAHRGAEQHVFPRAIQAGTSVITFNNTCYGRLLRSRGDRPGPSATDCYRFSLAQPGVTMCLSAPANMEQLADTLAVVRQPTISDERRAQLAAWGEEVYREEKLFQQLIRSR